MKSSNGHTNGHTILGDTRRAQLHDMCSGDHAVQFYENDSFLVDTVAAFAAAGLGGDDSVIIIATKDHRAGVEKQLSDSGVDIAAWKKSGRLVLLDAAETLGFFMRNGRPDQPKFSKVIGEVITRAASVGRQVRAFGEMVAILWAEGNQEAAVELEAHWNDLAREHRFSLLCAYPLQQFSGIKEDEAILRVCDHHSAILPAESFGECADIADFGRRIALLQQKSVTLDGEVAQRQKAEKELSAREVELADFLENAAVGLHKVGPDGTILWANRAELEMLGYTAAEYVGRNVVDFHVDRDVIDDILAKLLCGGTLLDRPARLRCKDGTIKKVRIHSNGRWEEGQFLHTRCFTRDVTALEESHFLVEKQLQERTDELRRSHERLRLAERLASVGTFASGIAHEINNPLNAILLIAEYALRSGNEVDRAEFFEQIKKEAERGGRIVRDLLKFSKEEQTAKQAGDLNAIVGHATSLLATYAPDAKANLRIELDSKLPPVRINETEIQQSIVTLLKNAAETPGVNNVHVRTYGQNGSAVLTVTDDGAGIPEAVCNHIFDPFFTTKRRFGGTGLGLALAHRIAAAHHGELRVESTIGKATTFTLVLPACVPQTSS